MSANNAINETLDGIDKRLKHFTNIYVQRYKKGSVISEFRFIADSDAHAQKLSDIWLNNERSKDNSKIVPISGPKPFAIDVMKEISVEKEKNAKTA